ncbi:MAG: mandelate racemase/muconate lactonizing enzyme family protein [Acidobacteria bacterium]|jgi:D-arabinonate dehydratase|nr:mandelate racemase/muconate lactonizing enzyme family protein [Acidobacteriota bacterium]
MNSKIVEVRAIPIERKLDKVFRGGTYAIQSRYTLVTEVRLANGVVGQVFGGDEERYQKDVCGLINGRFQELLLGEDAMNVERLWHRMFGDKKLGQMNRGIHVLDLANRAILMQAIAGVDIALWDAIGKSMGTSVSKLLGGYRDKVPVIAIGGYYVRGAGEADLRQEVVAYKEGGMYGMKLKVGGLTPAEDADRVRLVREAVGDDFVIACDANQAWTVSEALEFCARVKPYKVRWFEEPVQWYDQLQGLQLVRAQGGIPVVAGQGEISAYGCRDLVTAHAVDALNVDVTIAGGITEWRRVASMAGPMNIGMAHHEEPQVALHLLTAIPHGLYVEIFPNPERDPLWFELPEKQPRIAGGYMHVPDAPGLGMPLRTELIEQYRANALPA